jgi:dTDP-4-amino-4,6-dideoxygalactose transaminase
MAGLPCDMVRLAGLARKYEVPIVEDCAHAFPVRVNGKYAGTIGTTGVFSFYANKTITTGEGGMVVTDDDSIANRIRIMRLHGIDRVSWDRYTSIHGGWHYNVVDAGYKYNLTDIAAAIGIEQLKKADVLQAKRKGVALHYSEGLKDQDFLILPAYSEEHAWHLFIIRIDETKLTIGRDEVIRKLKDAGIGTSVHYIPLHIMPYYKNLYGFTPDRFPVALGNYRTSISIPIYPDLTHEQVERVISSLVDIGAHFYKNTHFVLA